MLFILAKGKSVLRANWLTARGPEPLDVDRVCFVFSGRDARSWGILYAILLSKQWLSTLIDGARFRVYVNMVPPMLVSNFAVTNHLQFSGLKNTYLLSDKTGGQKSGTGLTGLKISTSAELCSFLETLGEKLFPCLFQHLEPARRTWLTAFFLHLQS